MVRRQPTARDLDVARVSQDGRSQLVSFSLAGDGETTEAAVEPIVAAVERVAREHPGVYVGQFGAASAGVALSESLAEDFERAELLSLPLTLVILLIAFGGVVAAGIPLLLALTGVATTLGLVSLISQAIPMTRPWPRSCCSSVSRSAWTTRSSTCAASVRSGAVAPRRPKPSRRRRRPRGARCSSPARR